MCSRFKARRRNDFDGEMNLLRYAAIASCSRKQFVKLAESFPRLASIRTSRAYLPAITMAGNGRGRVGTRLRVRRRLLPTQRPTTIGYRELNTPPTSTRFWPEPKSANQEPPEVPAEQPASRQAITTFLKAAAYFLAGLALASEPAGDFISCLGGGRLAHRVSFLMFILISICRRRWRSCSRLLH